MLPDAFTATRMTGPTHLTVRTVSLERGEGSIFEIRGLDR